MNNLENAFTEVSTIGEYSRKYFSYLVDVLNSIELLNVIDRDTLWDLHHADELNRFFNEKK